VAALAVLTLAMGASAASAAPSSGVKGSCSGHIQERKEIVSHTFKQHLGWAELWYSSAYGGQNCVITRIDAAMPIFASAVIEVDYNNDRQFEEGIDAFASDQGPFQKYAGASYVNYTAHHCIYWGALIQAHLVDDWAHIVTDSGYVLGDPLWSHCG
jgi:hypothetical protein